MIMIRNTMLALTLFGLSAGSAFAGTPAVKHHSTRTVAEAPAGETAAPADKAAPAKKEKKAKKEKGEKAGKEAAPKAEGGKDMKAPETK
jgi:hypothetical protein